MKDWYTLEPDEYKLVPSSNYTSGRGGNSINKVVVHHNAGRLTNQGVYNAFISNGTSAHYNVDSSGTICQYVYDSNTAWHAGNWNANQTSIGIEHCNTQSSSPWTIPDATLEEGAHLTAAVCYKFGLGRPTWKQNVFPHNYYKSTSCLPTGITELLTPTGWRVLDDIEVGDMVAAVRFDDLHMTFTPVRSMVEPHKRGCWKSRDFEATADHRMITRTQSGDRIVISWADVCGCTNQTTTQSRYIPNAATSTDAPGLPLTDSELELIIAVQADGHYSRDSRRGGALESVRFHLKKERKIERLIELLDDTGYRYTVNIKKDGSTDIIIEKALYTLCEQYLDNKKLTWRLFDMDAHQRELFLDRVQDWDGCRANQSYASSVKSNLDIVQAIAATSGVGTKLDEKGKRVYFKRPERTVANSGSKRTYDRIVSCVTVDQGFILIRQHGRTTVTGNCPGEIGGSQNAKYMERAQYWYDVMTGAISTSTSTSTATKVEVVKVECAIQAAANLTDSQLWKLNSQGDDYYTIECKRGGVLDMIGGTDAGPAENYRDVWTHTANDTPAQKWKMIDSPEIDGAYMFANSIDENYVIDAVGGPVAERGYVQMHKIQSEKVNQWAQSWYLIPYWNDSSYYVLVNAKSLYVLDANPQALDVS